MLKHNVAIDAGGQVEIPVAEKMFWLGIDQDKPTTPMAQTVVWKSISRTQNRYNIRVPTPTI